jgi:glycosyltransferase involved in cell wall biosynthesis
MLASRLSRLPYSFTAHGSEEFEKAPLLSLNAKLSEAKFAVCVSSFGRAQLMRWTRPKNWEKISVVHCGLDQVFLNRESIPVPDNKRFVCVGRLDEHKAQIVLIAAARLLKEQNLSCQIILVGDGYWRGEVEKAIEQAGLQDKIVITGWVTGEEVKRHIESSRALVLPSFSENMPVVIMEALALGRPVISTFVAGIPELVHPGKNGWLVPAGDVTALADAMKEALTCPLSILSDMGQYGRDHVTKNHDANTEAAKLKKLFLAHAKSSLDLIIKSS